MEDWENFATEDKTEDLRENGRLSRAVETECFRAREASLAFFSQHSVKTGVRSWGRFCTYFGIDHSCAGAAEVTLTIDDLSVLISRYVAYECGVREVSLDSVSRVYIGAIANGFAMVDQATNFRAAAKTERVRFMVRSFTRLFNTAHSKALRSSWLTVLKS
jgi:hypothetical protein